MIISHRPLLIAYSRETAWREDHRRMSDGEQYLMTEAAALGHPVSRQWKGYWQSAALRRAQNADRI